MGGRETDGIEVFLLNILVAQLNCSYQLIFQDMVGYARAGPNFTARCEAFGG